MNGRNRETEATMERMAELYRGGLSIEKVARATGTTRGRVYKQLREAGVTIRSRHRKKPTCERKLAITPVEMARRYREGESLEVVGWRAHASGSTVARTLREMGVEIRPRPERPVPKLPPETIAERYRSGESAGHLAKEAEARVADIREILVEMGEELRPPLGNVQRHLDHPWFTPERIETLYGEGESVKALARASGVSRETVRTFLLKRGVTLRGRGGGPSPGPEQIVDNPDEVRSRYEAGDGIVAIAKALESTAWRVRTVLLQLGVKLRGRTGRKGDGGKPPPMSAEEVAALYRSGMSLERIGARSRTGKSMLRRMLRKQGVEMRSPAEAVAQPEVQRTLSDAQVARRYRKGESLENLAMAAETTAAVIRRVLRDRRVKLRPKEAELRHAPEEIARLYREGKSIMDLAAMEGCSNHPIRELLLGQGVVIRKNTEMAEKRSAQPLLAPGEMEARYRAGSSLSQIAGEAGIDVRRVAVILRRRGVRLRGRGATPKDDREGLGITPEEMEARYRAGETLTAIAERAASNRKRVGAILKRRGVGIRKRQDYGA